MAIDPSKIGGQIRRRRGERPQEEIAEATGVSQSAIDRIEKGAWKKLSANVITLCRYYGISIPGIRFDEHIDSSELALDLGPDNAAGLPELEARAGLGGGGLSTIEIQHGSKTLDAVKPDRWHLPPGFIRDELRAMPSGVIVVETQGDSMVPTLAPGERVFVDTNHSRPSPDGVYAMRDQFGGLIIKRIHALTKRGVFSIISDNPAHPPREVTGRDLEGEIVGRVVGAIKRL